MWKKLKQQSAMGHRNADDKSCQARSQKFAMGGGGCFGGSNNKVQKKKLKQQSAMGHRNVDNKSCQARSQKFAMGGGAVLGVWGRSPQPPEANGSLGAEPPAAGGTGVEGRSPQRSKILRFFAKKLNFRVILIKKIMLLKRGLEIGSANMIKLVA